MYKVNHILRWFVWYVLYHMRNGWMEEKLGEDRSDSFVAMRLEKLKIKDPINSFRRCPFYLFLSLYNIQRSALRDPAHFMRGEGWNKEMNVNKEITNFQNNLLTLRGSCVLTFFQVEVLFTYPRECQTTQYRIVFFIIYLSDHRPAMLYNEGRHSIFRSQERLDVVLSIVPFHIALEPVK